MMLGSSSFFPENVDSVSQVNGSVLLVYMWSSCLPGVEMCICHPGPGQRALEAAAFSFARFCRGLRAFVL